MAIIFNIRREKPGKIGKLVIDARLSENIVYSNNINVKVLENRSNISDNIYSEPIRINIDGIVSKYPVKFLGGIFTGQNNGDNVINAFNLLEKMFYNKDVIDVQTSYKLYKNMVIQSISIPKTREVGKDLRFSIALQEIKFVNLEISKIDVTKLVEFKDKAKNIKKRAVSKKDKGLQNGKNVNQKKSSWALELIRAIRGK